MSQNKKIRFDRYQTLKIQTSLVENNQVLFSFHLLNYGVSSVPNFKLNNVTLSIFKYNLQSHL